MQIILIAAMSKNHVIGYKNTIPWRIKGEQLLFKNHTLGHVILMGRKTYESIGKSLPGRKNIIITSQQNYQADSEALVYNSIEQALQNCVNFTKVFVIGGEQIYKQTISIADYIYLTIINREIYGDSYFPNIKNNFKLISSEKIQLSEEVTFNIYQRINRLPRKLTSGSNYTKTLSTEP